LMIWRETLLGESRLVWWVWWRAWTWGGMIDLLCEFAQGVLAWFVTRGGSLG
jgi:hypothetical protein